MGDCIFCNHSNFGYRILIGLFVRKWVSLPVNDLLGGTKQVSAGNLNYSIKDLGK